MRILVTIASYGTKNDHFLHRLIEHYGTFPHEVRIVVLCNQAKPVPPHCELKVGLPSANPWSLPFAHQPIFAARKDDYDLYIYSEDDTPITLNGLEAFLNYSKHLPADQLPGFLRYEVAPDGQRYVSTAHAHFHWLVDSVARTPAGYVAQFSNEHAAAYVITRAQLHRALASGRFVVPPHEGRHDLLCSAATDIYTQCGFKKVVGISHFDDFLLHHMPNKYLGRMGVSVEAFRRMIQVMEQIADGKHPRTNLPEVLRAGDYDRWLPFYYEPPNEMLLSAVPVAARDVLMIGCGWGLTERALMDRGQRVVALPLDSLIGALAADRGVEVRYETIGMSWAEVGAGAFDCVVVNSMLPLVAQPDQLLHRAISCLRPAGTLVVRSPNFGSLFSRRHRFKRTPGFHSFEPFRATGVRPYSLGTLRGWLRRAGLRLEGETFRPGGGEKLPGWMQAGLPRSLLSTEAILRARRP